jgi:hypothetical protein
MNGSILKHLPNRNLPSQQAAGEYREGERERERERERGHASMRAFVMPEQEQQFLGSPFFLSLSPFAPIPSFPCVVGTELSSMPLCTGYGQREHCDNANNGGES